MGNRNADMIAVAAYIGERFGIYTYDPVRLAKFARDLLGSGIRFTAGMLALKESLERVAKW